MSALDDLRMPQPAGSPAGLSAHSRALWRRAARYRQLADELGSAAGASGGSAP